MKKCLVIILLCVTFLTACTKENASTSIIQAPTPQSQNEGSPDSIPQDKTVQVHQKLSYDNYVASEFYINVRKQIDYKSGWHISSEISTDLINDIYRLHYLDKTIGKQAISKGNVITLIANDYRIIENGAYFIENYSELYFYCTITHTKELLFKSETSISNVFGDEHSAFFMNEAKEVYRLHKVSKNLDLIKALPANATAFYPLTSHSIWWYELVDGKEAIKFYSAKTQENKVPELAPLFRNAEKYDETFYNISQNRLNSYNIFVASQKQYDAKFGDLAEEYKANYNMFNVNKSSKYEYLTKTVDGDNNYGLTTAGNKNIICANTTLSLAAQHYGYYVLDDYMLYEYDAETTLSNLLFIASQPIVYLQGNDDAVLLRLENDVVYRVHRQSGIADLVAATPEDARFYTNNIIYWQRGTLNKKPVNMTGTVETVYFDMRTGRFTAPPQV